MQFLTLAHHFSLLEQATSRLTMTELLAKLFDELTVDEIDKVLYLLQGRVSPLYVKQDFGMAEKMIIKSIARMFSLPEKGVSTLVRERGDIGAALETLKASQEQLIHQSCDVEYVFSQLQKITLMQGAGSQDLKIATLAELIRALDPLSCRYLVRIPTNTLRLGFSDMTILDAFSWQLRRDKSLKKTIEQVYQVRPDIGYIGKVLKREGMSGLDHIVPRLFTPILMMKAERLSDAAEIIEKAGKGSFIEPKFDGFRLQIHSRAHPSKPTKVAIFSRGLDDVTYMYPDIVEGVTKQTTHSCIFEGEAIGFNEQTGDFLPFQETVQRKRKYLITEKTQEIPLKVFAFDLLYYDTSDVLKKELHERRELLKKAIHTVDIDEDVVSVTKTQVVSEPRDIELAFSEAISQGLEGLVVKKRDGVYQPGGRGFNWIKFKRSYSAKLDDTIDCVVMGFDMGKGKRANFGIGAFLAGVYDKEKDMFVTVAKIGTGLTDEEWMDLKRQCDKLKTQKKPPLYDVDKQMYPDIWITPKIVVEIRSDEITRSPSHTSGRILRKSKSGQAMEVDEPGYALRFPRLERFRADRQPADATTLSEIVSIWSQQRQLLVSKS